MIIAGIVCYHPQTSILKKSLDSIAGNVSGIVVIDNGSDNVEEISECCQSHPNVELIKNAKNEGIAKALNQIFRRADEMGGDYVLCLDQDSIMPEGMMQTYEKVLRDHSGKERIGILCPRIHDRATDRTWPAVPDGVQVSKVERCITSGSLNSLQAWKEVGGFDEYLFIDEVDHDYSFQIIQKGYAILLCPDVVIDHQIGNTVIRHLFGKTIYVRNHNAFRKYYMARNMIYVGKKHYGRVRVRDVGHAVLFTLKTFIYESDKRNKLKACFKGMADGCKHNHGENIKV